MARPRLNLLLILPPLVFLGFATAAYVGLRQDHPDELPSALVGGPAPAMDRLVALRDDPAPTAADLMASLREVDDHGLLDWCFLGSGQTVRPFSKLRKNHPQVWAQCVASLETSVGL